MHMKSNDPVKLWEQREDESEKAFEAFEFYLRLGSERSLAKAGQLLGKSTTLLENWSRKHLWQSRVRAHTRWVAREVNEEILMGTADMRRRHVSAAIAIQNQASSRLRSMSPKELDNLTVSEMLSMLKVGAATEAKSREIKPEEIEADQAFIAPPVFNISFIPDLPVGMVAVRLPTGETGYIPKEKVEAFLADYPEGTVIA
jgi:hypothetical protein